MLQTMQFGSSTQSHPKMWWDEALVGLIIHFLLYAIVFILAAFWAARSFRRRNDPERKSLSQMEGKALEPGPEPAGEGICAEISTFATDPLPFMKNTSDADDDTVLMKAGLDSLIYLHILKAMLVLFLVLSALGVMVLLPLNLYTDRKPWFNMDSFLISTANGFRGPSHSLLLHTMISIFIALCMIAVVFMLRQFLLMYCRTAADNADAIPPVQAYTVEIQGLRLDPPVSADELKPLVDEVAPGRALAVSVALDVTDIVDRVEKGRVLRKRLGRYRQQLENDKERPTVQTGILRWVGCGTEVDAITMTEKEIDALDKEVDKLRQTPGRVGTGTAFITFTKRPVAVAFIEKFKNPMKARKACGYPTIGKGPDFVCENQNKWVVELAVKPEDIFWRNLRYSSLHRALLTVAGFIFLVVILAFIVTPIFFVQLFLAVGDATVAEFDEVKNEMSGHTSYEGFYQAEKDAKKFNQWALLTLQFVWPFMVLIINFFIMPALVNYSAKFMGQRYVSSMQRTTFNLIFFFMVLNILIFPALALNGLDEFIRVTNAVPLNQILGQVLLYGSNTSFFVDYIAQSALLGSAFYFVFHTTTPMVSDWYGKGSGVQENLVWEFDFAYFYSSLLSVLAIGFVFAVTVPLVLPCVLLFLAMRYYTDKWQLQTAHNTERVDPAPETTASAVLVSILVVTALSQAAFASWLSLQGAWNLAIWPWITAISLFGFIAVPYTRHKFVTVSNKWRATKEEHPATWETEAIPAYAGAYENPYLEENSKRASRLRGDITASGPWAGV